MVERSPCPEDIAMLESLVSQVELSEVGDDRMLFCYGMEFNSVWRRGIFVVKVDFVMIFVYVDNSDVCVRIFAHKSMGK